jgi:hypothetical protein
LLILGLAPVSGTAQTAVSEDLSVGVPITVPAAVSDTTLPELAPQAAEVWVDAWGQGKNMPLGVGEILIANAVPWAFNEYVRNANFSQQNPKSWYDNITGGWKWDDNNFATNMFAHPYQGSLYFSAMRSNGYGYWASAPWAFVGSFIWECCGETHPAAWNDFMTTGFGGIAIGEALYRISSTVLDNQATGSERTWREVGGFALNPIRGFTRFVTGNATRVYENPESPYDWVPPHLSNVLSTGVRVVKDEGLVEGESAHAFFEVDFQFGSPFNNERHKPFDFFTMGFQINFRDKQAIGRWQIAGSLTEKSLKVTEKSNHRLLLLHNYDYLNNNAFEYGAQALTGTLLSGWQLSPDWQLATRVSGIAQIFGAVNFAGAALAEFETQERIREYDFGPGAGGSLAVTVVRKNQRVLDVGYRYTWMKASNGAVHTTEDGTVEDHASHHLQFFYARARIPVHNNFSLGADYLGYLRNTEFKDPRFADDLFQRVREFRIFGAWSVGKGSAER